MKFALFPKHRRRNGGKTTAVRQLSGGDGRLGELVYTSLPWNLSPARLRAIGERGEI